MKTVLMLSYGKDSMACIEAAFQLGIHIDEIRHIEIMFDEDTCADVPAIMEFKKYANAKIKERYGLDVVTVRSPHTFKDLALMHWTKQPGVPHGYPLPDRQARWCRNEMKIKPFNDKNEIKLIGIAIDEKERCEKNNPNVRYPLCELEWTEPYCLEWCRENDLLSPVYTEEKRVRSGCFFCHLQTYDALKTTFNTYPELWRKWLELDRELQRQKKDGTVPFSFREGDEKWLTDYDIRIRLEKNGVIPDDQTFRWHQVEPEGRDQTRVLVMDYSPEAIATIEACYWLNLRVDVVRTMNLKFDDETEADHPKILEYKNKVDEWIKERVGAKIEKVYHENTYKFYFLMDFTKQPGRMHGYPHLNGRWCREVMKNKWQLFHYDDMKETYYKPLPYDRKDEAYTKKQNIFPLIMMEWTREDCVNIVEELGLTAPREDDFCWYCPFMKIGRLKELRENYPELWNKWLEIDKIAVSKWTGDPKDSPVKMKGRWWLSGFDKRFRAEEKGLVPSDGRFRWGMIDELEDEF